MCLNSHDHTTCDLGRKTFFKHLNAVHILYNPLLLLLSFLFSTPQNKYRFANGAGPFLLIAVFSLRSVLSAVLEHRKGCWLGSKKGIASFFNFTSPNDVPQANRDAVSNLLTAVSDGTHDNMMMEWSGIPEHIPLNARDVEKYIEAILSPMRGLFCYHHAFWFCPSVRLFVYCSARHARTHILLFVHSRCRHG